MAEKMAAKDTIYLDRQTFDALSRFLREQGKEDAVSDGAVQIGDVEMVPMDVIFNG